MKLSICIDMLFFGQDFIPAMEKVKATGFDHYEMWSLGDHPLGIGAKNKDIEAIAKEADRLDMTCAACLGPFSDLTNSARHADFLHDFKSDLARARKINCPTIIISLGGAIEPTDPNGTTEAATKVLHEAAMMAQSEGITIALEPLNNRVDHKNSVLAYALDGFAIVDEINSPAMKLLYDIYHQQIMDGNVTETIVSNLDNIIHLHAAGVPGRHELVPGELDYRFVLQKVAQAGYEHYAGLEYEPIKDPIESLKEMRTLLADVLS